MNRCLAGALCLAFASAAGTYAWTRSHREPGSAPAADLVVIEGSTKHLVSEEMAESSRAMLRRIAPPFEAVASDGRACKLGELLRNGPVVLTFIKTGCPCSEAAQPFFNRVHAAYPDARFLGVIDAEADAAARWAERFRIAYPLLLDPGLRIVRDYEVENSAYIVVIDPGGRIVRHWPGYSADMLRELGLTLAGLTGAAERPIDVADAPEQEYSGCPFDL